MYTKELSKRYIMAYLTVFLHCTVAAPQQSCEQGWGGPASPCQTHPSPLDCLDVRSVNTLLCRSENRGSKRSSGFIRPQRISLWELKAGAWRGGERFVQRSGLQRPVPCKSSHALISHLNLQLTLSLAIFAAGAAGADVF